MERYIIGENNSGKTRKMLERAVANNAIVVCKNPHSMESKANCYGIYGLRFASYEDMDTHILNGDKIAIDEIGNFFEYCYGVKLDSFTMTID